MIFGGEFISGIDLVDVTLWLFTLFFLGLVLYLQREGMREGYPTEEDKSGRMNKGGFFFKPQPKTFIQPHGRETITAGFRGRDTRDLALQRTAPWDGAPYSPTGDPLVDGVGPASYAEREDIADLTLEGAPRIAPFRASPGFEVAANDRDPRGLPVKGGDGQIAGTVTDLWVDRSEAIIRYLEVGVDMPDGTVRNVLLPVPFSKVVGGRKPHVAVDAIFADHFKRVPTTKDPLSVTRLEEDKICGYYGGGKLYADNKRTESFL